MKKGEDKQKDRQQEIIVYDASIGAYTLMVQDFNVSFMIAVIHFPL